MVLHGDVIHIAGEFPDEFTESKYTKKLRGGLAKANSGQAIGEMIENPQNRRWIENKDEKHKKRSEYAALVRRPYGKKPLLFKTKLTRSLSDVKNILKMRTA